MGSEHSTQGAQRQGSLDKQKQINIRRQHTIANPSSSVNDEPDPDGGRPGSISPGPSLCSDIDLPYISYTVNRPIGDSPKLANKQLVKPKATRKMQQIKQLKSKSPHNIVVVRGGSTAIPGTEKDPDVVRLQGMSFCLDFQHCRLFVYSLLFK
nr:unnamed protein product [Callosobruchus chinensis]CAH7764931.1 unnamed protein product [Callosobruchus chinensis]